MQRLSDDLITISTMMMVARERKDIIHLANELNGIIQKAMEIEETHVYQVPIIQQKTLSASLKFTEKEILQMPKQYRAIFRKKENLPNVRKRTDGRYKCSYEIRYAKKPFNNPPISASGPTLEIAKQEFFKKLKNYVSRDAVVPTVSTVPTIPDNFNDFAMYWFEDFHKAKVKVKTYYNNFKLYERHIKDKLAIYKVCDITPMMLKDLLSKLPGNGKTADDVHSILNQIFETAVSHGKIKVNPLNLFVHILHDKETGIALTMDEELTLLNAFKGTVYEIIFSVFLYAGLRPNEYKTARIEGNFIVAVNSKQKNGKIEYKKIPICSYLRSHLINITELPKRYESTIRDNFNKVLPHHTLKDLRKTFNTRCKKCKIDLYAKEKYMGHSVGKLEKTYTGNLDDFLLEEGLKLDNWYSCTPNVPQKTE